MNQLDPPYDLKIYAQYRHVNTDVPAELAKFIEKNHNKRHANNHAYNNGNNNGHHAHNNNQNNAQHDGQQPNYNINWRKNDPKFKVSWLVTNKTNQDENEKIYSSIRGILNKISEKKFDIMTEELMNLMSTDNINVNHLEELASIIFQKALSEPKYSQLYSKLCIKLAPYYIEDGEKQVFFRELLLNKCQALFEECISKQDDIEISKERVMGCMTFIGELYNINLLTNNIIYGCFMALLVKIALKCVYTIESTCVLMSVIGKEFVRKDITKVEICINKISQLLTSTEISKREKFMIQDVIENIKKITELTYAK
jgi:translation initiation factor 4G